MTRRPVWNHGSSLALAVTLLSGSPGIAAARAPTGPANPVALHAPTSRDSRLAASRVVADHSIAGPFLSGQSLTGRSIDGQSVTGRSIDGQSVTDQSATGQSVTGQTSTSPLNAAPPGLPPPPTNSPTCRNWYPDCDGDGYGDSSAAFYTCKNPNWGPNAPVCTYLRNGTDCDDVDPRISPAAVEGADAPETTVDGLDNDCDGYVDIDCDGTSGAALPLVAISSPARGLFTSLSTITVTGVAYPNQTRTALQSVTVAGNAASSQACSDDGGLFFQASVPLKAGVQTIAVLAQDENGAADRALTSVAQSGRFVNLKAGPVRGALATNLNQGSWNILGDYLESYMTPQEVQAELLALNPLVNESGDYDCLESWQLYANATAYTHDDFQVGFTVTGGRVAVTAKLVHPQIWASGYAYYDLEWYCGSWDDHVDLTAYASFSEVDATADGYLSVDANHNIQVSFQNVGVDARGIYLDVDADSSIYDWLIDLFEDDLASELESFLEDELRDYVSQDLGPDLASELNTLDLSYTVDMGGIPYGVSFSYDTLSVQEGSVPLGFAMGLTYSKDPRIPANPGAVGLPTSYTLDKAPTLGFDIGDDFFNASLHALWEGGSLNIEDTLWEAPLITGSASPLLPPVVVPGITPYLLELDMGDVIADLTLYSSGQTYPVRAAISAKVNADLDPVVTGSTIGFDVTFGPAQVSYDLLDSAPIPANLVTASESAMNQLMNLLLAELETYLEALQISYLDLPMRIDSLTLDAEPGNPAMIGVDMNATYVGP